MGRVKTKDIKRLGKEIIKMKGDILAKDFETNKKILNEMGVFKEKKMRNRVAGYITNKMNQKIFVPEEKDIDSDIVFGSNE